MRFFRASPVRAAQRAVEAVHGRVLPPLHLGAQRALESQPPADEGDVQIGTRRQQDQAVPDRAMGLECGQSGRPVGAPPIQPGHVGRGPFIDIGARVAAHDRTNELRFQDAAVAMRCQIAHEGERHAPQPKHPPGAPRRISQQIRQQGVVPGQRPVEIENGDPGDGGGRASCRHPRNILFLDLVDLRALQREIGDQALLGEYEGQDGLFHAGAVVIGAGALRDYR